ncbi:hypothetical protein JOC78_001024 [Bacillus ectoiniformans]|nr:hypothetical protein [Bacillus ectoiniformans]
MTKSSSRYKNRSTNVNRSSFEKALVTGGWKKSISKDGKTTIYTKKGAKYVLHNSSKFTGAPTADYYAKGSKKINVKIRLGGGNN